MCDLPVLNRFCRESYNSPQAIYEELKRRGMDLVTVTDHDSIDAAEHLRKFPDFFLSEEVTCRTPSGTVIHVGVYDLNERQHLEVQRRRNDVPSLAAYLNEQQLFYSLKHPFSSLTGRRVRRDLYLFETLFPAFEVLNGHLPAGGNNLASWAAERMGKTAVAGSDAHSAGAVGRTYTEVPGARNKQEFVQGLWQGRARAGGNSGGFARVLTELTSVACSLFQERPAAALFSPLMALLPAAALANYLAEQWFCGRWEKQVAKRWGGRRAAVAPSPREAAA